MAVADASGNQIAKVSGLRHRRGGDRLLINAARLVSAETGRQGGGEPE